MGSIKKFALPLMIWLFILIQTDHKDKLIVELENFKMVSKLFLVIGYVRTECQGV